MVYVFANWAPNTTKISLDKWKIRELIFDEIDQEYTFENVTKACIKRNYGREKNIDDNVFAIEPSIVGFGKQVGRNIIPLRSPNKTKKFLISKEDLESSIEIEEVAKDDDVYTID